MEEREAAVTAPTSTGPVDPGAARLSETEAGVRRAAFRSILRRRAPDRSQLAGATGLDVQAVDEAVASLVRKGQAVVDAAGRVVGSAGLSLVPARHRHRLRLGRDQFHTWCTIDAIGIPAALGADGVVTTSCPTCGRSIEVGFRKGGASDDPDLRAWLSAQDCCASVVDERCAGHEPVLRHGASAGVATPARRSALEGADPERNRGTQAAVVGRSGVSAAGTASVREEVSR